MTRPEAGCRKELGGASRDARELRQPSYPGQIGALLT